MASSLGRTDDHSAAGCRAEKRAKLNFTKAENLVKANCENSNENSVPIYFLVLFIIYSISQQLPL